MRRREGVTDSVNPFSIQKWTVLLVQTMYVIGQPVLEEIHDRLRQRRLSLEILLPEIDYGHGELIVHFFVTFVVGIAVRLHQLFFGCEVVFRVRDERIQYLPDDLPALAHLHGIMQLVDKVYQLLVFFVKLPDLYLSFSFHVNSAITLSG